MSFWEKLGDVVCNTLAGAVTVTALPVILPVAAISAAKEVMTEGAREEGYRQGKSEADATHALALGELRDRLNQVLSKLKNSAEHYQAIFAMQAVALATANCDGYICDAERGQIELFIHGVSQSSLPEDVKTKISEIYEKKPNIKEAFELAKVSGVELDIFDQIIDVVIYADEVQHQNEVVFLQAWNDLKAA